MIRRRTHAVCATYVASMRRAHRAFGDTSLPGAALPSLTRPQRVAWGGRVVAALCLLLVGTPVQAQQVNTTTGAPDSWSGWGLSSDGIDRFGVGQLFTVPTATSFLESFSFWMVADHFSGESLFRAHLASWNEATQTFSDLWTSGERNVVSPEFNSGSPLSQWGEQSFAPGSGLTPGATYLAYLDVSTVLSLKNGYAADGVAFRGVTPGQGGMIGLRNGAFDGDYSDLDAAFTATFSDGTVVPEPSTVFLLATGLLALGATAWRRKGEESGRA